MTAVDGRRDAPHRATLAMMPTIPRHLRGPALVALCAAVACLCAAAAAWAQAPDVAAAPAAAAATDPTLALLQALGPTGGAGAVVALVWRAWRAEADRHAEERAELRRQIGELATAQAQLRLDLALTRQALDGVRDLLRAAT